MAQQHFNVGEMRELLVALPQPAEQCQITNRSDSIRIILRVEAERLQKLRQQKLGLMQDLLTGKVPVPVDAPETAPRP
jgi:type I restriction enzyme S subunit